MSKKSKPLIQTLDLDPVLTDCGKPLMILHFKLLIYSSIVTMLLFTSFGYTVITDCDVAQPELI